MAHDDDGHRRSGKPCPDCGKPLCRIPVPDHHLFQDARDAADAFWQAHFGGNDESLALIATTGILLFLRVCRRLDVPSEHGVLVGAAALYVKLTRQLIAERRERHARETAEAAERARVN